jgi:hypothetical protein
MGEDSGTSAGLQSCTPAPAAPWTHTGQAQLQAHTQLWKQASELPMALQNWCEYVERDGGHQENCLMRDKSDAV